MPIYARGRHSRAVCDRCGFAYPYRVLKREWTGLYVCRECFDYKHPQLTPPSLRGEGIALKHPRPEVSVVTAVTEPSDPPADAWTFSPFWE